ncbi:Uncharacterised protein [Mycobacteroides abscessus subsp. abscessus]|nr:Uncharacterised protein [Mycobacteroides abscessus subsp. abscessus]
MLHLNSRIDLEENEPIARDEELDRRQPAISIGGTQPCRARVQSGTHLVGEMLCRCDLDELLMSALHTAVAITERECCCS